MVIYLGHIMLISMYIISQFIGPLSTIELLFHSFMFHLVGYYYC